MSYQASHAVAELSEARSNDRLVAFVLAEAAGLEDASCYLSLDTLARRTRCHRNTAHAAVGRLAELGELRVWTRCVRRPDGAVNLYQLVLEGLPHDQRPPQAQGDPDMGPGFSQVSGEPVVTSPAGGSHDSAGGSHDQVVRKKSLGKVKQPSTATAPGARASEEKPDRRSKVPDDFPDELRAAANEVYRILKSVAADHNAQCVWPQAVAKAMVGHRHKPHVAVAHELAVWAVDPPRPIRSVVGTYVTFLKKARDIEGRERWDGSAPDNVHRIRPGHDRMGRRLSDRELVLQGLDEAIARSEGEPG